MKQYVAGIDIGATNTKIGIVDKYGNILARKNIPSNQTTDEILFIKDLCQNIKALQKECNIDSIEGIGIGAPNGNFLNKSIDYAQNTSWGKNKIIPFAKIMNKYINVPILLTNDANAAALGEQMFGNARGIKNFIEITLGTGVGAGVMIDNKILYGSNGMAGELGHYKVRLRKNRECTCGNHDCLESYCSARGIVNTAKQILENKNIITSLRDYPEKDISSQIIFEEGRKGDQVCIDIYKQMGKLLGEAFADFTAFFAPEKIIIFGGVSKARELFYQSLIEHYNKNVLPIYKEHNIIYFSSLPDSDAAILGASSLVLQNKHL